MKTNIIISDLYETKISTTSSQILLNDIITITVKLIDYDGAIVNRDNITINCNKGKFTNNSQSYTGNTTNGILTVDYKASENGIVTFQCNNTLYYILVFGKKMMKITTQYDNRNLIIDEYNRVCFFQYYYGGTYSLQNAYSSSQPLDSVCIIPAEYRPISSVRTPIYNNNAIAILSTNGKIYIRSIQNSGTISNTYITFQWTY